MTASLTLYDQLDDLIELIEEASMAPADLQPQYTEFVLAAVHGTKEKIDRCSAVLAALKATEDAANCEIARLTERRNHAIANATALKNYIREAMTATGLRKVEGNTSGFRIQKNPASVQVDTLDYVPAEYIRTIPAEHYPMKDELRKALQSGTVIEGVRLVQTERLART